jgi:hypothetical protein
LVELQLSICILFQSLFENNNLKNVWKDLDVFFLVYNLSYTL